MAASPLSIRGQAVGPAGTPPLQTGKVRIASARRVEPGAAARDGTPAAAPLAADEVVRVEYANGTSLWLRADDLLAERGRRVTARDGGAPVWEIDTAPPEGAERGLTAVAIKALEFFGVDIAGATAAEIGQRFEEHQLKGVRPGLYRAALDGGALAPAATVPAGRRVLVFLHGTMSSFRGSFGALEAPDGEARAKLRAAYGEQVYAFEHRTLTESPVKNALDLVACLAPGAELDLVSHSRGGLVGELLCLAEREGAPELPVDECFQRDRTIAETLGLPALAGADAKARDAAYAADAKALKLLVAQLDAKKIRVRRFVRVACPARGTTLASARLDRWLSVLDAAAGNGLFAEMADFLLAVVKKRTDPRTLPGVEAMLPGSALTRLLHAPDLTTRADLSVIAGDTEGAGLWGTLKTLVTDWFYGTDHDLVVNTGSMSGGIARSQGRARWLLDRGPAVNHFRYFTNADSQRWLLAGLARAEGESAGFLPFEQADTTAPPSRAAVAASRAAATPRPIVVVVPGTMGSALAVGDAEVWLSYWRLLKGGLADIGWGARNVKAVELLEQFYGPLLQHLAQAHRVEVFPYDWRLSVRASADALAAQLEALLPEAKRTQQPLHIVAHSMGGLVARSMIADGGRGSAVWREMGTLKASRLLMLGTPNRGLHEAVRWLAGANPTQAKLALLDLRHDTAGVIDIVRRFPGMVELLPFDDDRFAEPATWRQLRQQKVLDAKVPVVADDLLAGARQTWQRLRAAAPDRERMRYVAGCQDATVNGWQIQQHEGLPLPPRLRWTATREGDGTVTWASGLLEGVPAWYAPETAHDELCANADDRRVFRAYVDLLATGRTDQLPATAPAGTRGPAGERLDFLLPERPPADDLPDAATLRSLSFGGAPRRRRRAARAAPVVRVSLRHVDLGYARHAVLVGHYAGDTIVSAEAALDKRLGHALTARRDLGLYPGPQGTHAVFFNADPQGQPKAAVVVGLGQVGDLVAGRLQSDAADAMLHFALREAERHGGSGTRVAARLSCLLVGTGGAGLDVRESVEALLRAAVGANRRLEQAALDGQVLIDELEFIELYEDVAIGAAQALAEIADKSDIREALAWEPRALLEGTGRRRRRHYDSDRSWDQRIEISEADGRLQFSVATNRARDEETLATGQVALAETFVQGAVTSTANDSSVAQTLFEMLLPEGFKAAGPDARSMVLVVDRESARFPWELLQDRWSRNGRPLAIEAGIVRQFRTDAFRAQPQHAPAFSALVVGNPDLEGSPIFPDLPGARAEAGQVHRQLAGAKAEVKALVDAKAPAIVAALHEKGWRVLHLAGHGEHAWRPTPKAEPRSGMVIGREVMLTAGDVAQMRWVPELVFVNCCHLGRTDEPGRDPKAYHRLAANLGAEFIAMGVRAVVAAGWAVDDGAASAFAGTFYDRLLAGATFRDAVRAARERAFTDFPQANTWGAYQCYGDPAWRLVRDGAGGAPPPALPFVAPSELATELDNLAEWARAQARDRSVPEARIAGQQRSAIDALLARVPEALQDEWRSRADVSAALGFAYAQARLEDDALRELQRAMAASKGDCPLRAVEQWVNLRSTVDGRALRAAGTRPAERALLRQSIRDAIAQLAPLAPTAERLGLLGSAWKRLAWGSDGEDRVRALQAAAAGYAGAVDAAGGDNAWALTNWAAVVLLGRAQPDAPALRAADEARLRSAVAVQAAASAARADRAADVWDVTAAADLALVQLLLDAGDPAAVQAQAARARQGYERALAMGASAREQASMREQVTFLADLAAPLGGATVKALRSVEAVFA
ncbi:MAG: CHAT domain-containing protein [Rubrivivax sp.]